MGAQLSLLAQTSPSIAIFSYVDVLENIHYVAPMNSSKFLQTCKALDPNGEIVIKVFVKPRNGYDLSAVRSLLIREAMLLGQLPNVLNYSKLMETNRAGYLVRQHLKCNLYDRLSSRPFLQEAEVRFVAFQLIKILSDIHEFGIVHGDIKTENIFVTSWNWVILTDFSNGLKPVYLPEDNPGEFVFYFDTSRRRTCFVAPERFDSKKYAELYLEKSKESQSALTWQMDVFSAGCCIAELFSEGKPLFDLARLFKYKNSVRNTEDFFREQKFPSILRELIMDMVELDPMRRLPATKILDKYRGSFFPEEFYSFTYEYFRNLATLGTSTPSVGQICSHDILTAKACIPDKSIEKVYKDFVKITEALSLPMAKIEAPSLFIFGNNYWKNAGHEYHVMPHMFCLDTRKSKFHKINVIDSALLLVSFISQALRNCTLESNKLHGIDLLLAFSYFLSDDNKVDIVLPYIVSLLDSGRSPIEARAMASIVEILQSVKSLSPLNEYIFVDYLLPRLKLVLHRNDGNSYARMILASYLGTFGSIANKFQSLIFYKHCSDKSVDRLSQDFEIMSISNKYNQKLMKDFEEMAVNLLTDSEIHVKLALLSDVLPLCQFFGREKTNDIILSHLITYLNDKDTTLKVTLITTLPGISALVGPLSVEQYILPLLVQTLTDHDEIVVLAVLQSLKGLCHIGLIDRSRFSDIASLVSSLIIHPNHWIRNFSISLMIEFAEKMSKAEIYCVLYPILEPFCDFDVEFDFASFKASCRAPISRPIYNMLCSWSLRAQNTLFWRQVHSNKIDSFGNRIASFITKDFAMKNYGFKIKHKETEVIVNSFNKDEIPLTQEDKNWLTKIKNVGLHESDIWKIIMLREYVIKTTKSISKESDSTENFVEAIGIRDDLNLSFINIMPRTIFFDIDFLSSGSEHRVNTTLPSLIKEEENPPKNYKAFPTIVDIRGSLIINKKPSPTTTSCLENVYVQLEANANVNRDELNLKANGNYQVKDTYDGNLESIKVYLRHVQIIPDLKDFKEFGPSQNNHQGRAVIYDITGKLLARLTENESNPIISSEIMNGQCKLFLTGNDQGLLKFWHLRDLVDGLSYFSCFNYDCGSPITDMCRLEGRETIFVSTADGNISGFRLQYISQGSTYSLKDLKCIRKVSVSEITEQDFVTKIRIQRVRDTDYLLALSNQSHLYMFDIRNMALVQRITNPEVYGAVTSFAVISDSEVLILGTSKGVLSVWDMRFYILISQWTFGDQLPITHLETSNELDPWYVIVGGGSAMASLTLWNIKKIQCRLAFMPRKFQLPEKNHFEPIINNLDAIVDRKNHGKLGSVSFEAMVVDGPNVLLTKSYESILISVNLKDLFNTRTIIPASSSHNSKADFEVIKVSNSLAFIVHDSEVTPYTSAGRSPRITKDLVNCINIIKYKGHSTIFLSDQSGYTNVYV